MIVIAPANNKGGVGKTKTAILLTEYITRYLKKRTLAIDLDPQCSFSHRFIPMEPDPSSLQGFMPPIHSDYDPNDSENEGWDGRSSIADIFFNNSGVFPYSTHIDNLDVLPGHADKLLAAEAVRRSEVVEKVHNHLRDFLNLPEVREAYEVVIIDTSPSKGPLTVSAFRAASHIIIPTLMEQKSIEGLYGMLQLWMQESVRREKDNKLTLVGILPNMIRPINLHKQIQESLDFYKEVKKYVMPVKLRLLAAYAEVDSEGVIPNTIFDLPDNNPAKQEAFKVCEYITQRIFQND